MFSLLPFVEQASLYDMGKGQTGAAQLTAYTTRNATPVAFFICPSRRQALPITGGSVTYYNANASTVFARTDYAICVSSTGSVESFAGPPDLATGSNPAYWATGGGSGAANPTTFNGIAYSCSRVRITDITKGTTNQVMLGEKYLNPTNYTTGADPGDNECAFTGMNNDVCRSTANPPLKDQPGLGDTFRFGSQHLSGVNVVLADGSVRTITYNVAQTVFQPMGDIRSGAVISLP